MTHVFVVDKNTFKYHLEYMFAGTGGSRDASFLFDNKIQLHWKSEASVIDMISDISLEITTIIQNHDMVDWQTNKEIHNKIAQDIDDMFYKLEKECNFVIDFDTIDKIIENVITVALRRFK